MKERIETLEQLNELLSPDCSFSLGWSRAETTVEKMTWHLLESLPFEIDIILKCYYILNHIKIIITVDNYKKSSL